MEVWTEKYKPGTLPEILSQGKAVKDAIDFLKEWKKRKALFFYGSPGTGKTLLAEVLAKENNWFLISMNASDERSADSVERALTEASKSRSLFHKGKLILIDEVDGLGSGDRGGAGSIVKIIKESRFPVVCVANDPYSQKLRPLRNHCKLVKFSRVRSTSIEKRLKEICRSENVKFSDSAIKNLARWSSGDMRSAITDLQTLCQGREEIGDEDLEALGFRERGSGIFNILPTIFRSKNLKASRKVIRECDKDPDEIFWWIESNIHNQFRDRESVAKAFDILSKADIYRQKVIVQQNWRFRAFITDMMAGVSLAGEPAHGFVPYRPPDRLVMLGRSKQRRAETGRLYERIGRFTHTSKKVVKSSYLPYLKTILKKKKHSDTEGMEFSEEEKEIILSG